jgi:hypothetical protein
MEAKGDRRPGGGYRHRQRDRWGSTQRDRWGSRSGYWNERGGHGLGRTRLQSRGGRPADCRWLVSIQAVSGLLPVGCSTQWVLSPQGGFGPPNSLVSSSRCRSASLSIGYAMAIHKPMAVGGTRVVGSGMRVGRPAGGSSWPPRPHHPGAARPAPGGGRQPRLRRQLHPAQVLLAAGLSPTRALPPPWRPSTPRRWGAPSAGWSASAPTGCAATTATARARPRWPALRFPRLVDGAPGGRQRGDVPGATSKPSWSGPGHTATPRPRQIHGGPAARGRTD